MQDACTALACLNDRLPPFHYMVLRFGGDDVRCGRYATFGTQALADLAAVAINGRTACLLANHGMIVGGVDAKQALGAVVAAGDPLPPVPAGAIGRHATAAVQGRDAGGAGAVQNLRQAVAYAVRRTRRLLLDHGGPFNRVTEL